MVQYHGTIWYTCTYVRGTRVRTRVPWYTCANMVHVYVPWYVRPYNVMSQRTRVPYGTMVRTRLQIHHLKNDLTSTQVQRVLEYHWYGGPMVPLHTTNRGIGIGSTIAYYSIPLWYHVYH
jgi:hypothetical protein